MSIFEIASWIALGTVPITALVTVVRSVYTGNWLWTRFLLLPVILTALLLCFDMTRRQPVAIVNLIAALPFLLAAFCLVNMLAGLCTGGLPETETIE
ncbi:MULTISPECIES: hypothetical protein [Burkholderia]|uniref:Uncharacterized protein n=1 Tax=Burkholderia anthinoferrum TaxID=3090833 RepID=A0ABU5WW38_9BURK|nr:MULTISPECIES: hypothetical protein [Burkholderia]MEB2507334.1 hypothetical protein [Burkholderia anthinoferrum]MEB2535955.1 hypothetical protein [Burkholderia anthinoferrum]MEB2565155.1 hypothetical protein [Burkholderia anthinoferrum]MEB2583164.1 hypothetical protein [Burkholderia anthinoferrum]MBR8348687.1 hypothetical protein [Burkholderia ambifaria]